MQFDLNAVLPTFLSEAGEGLAGLEEGLLELDRACRRADEVVAEIFRVAHTLKGNADSLGFEGISRCAHALETVLDAIRRRAVALTPALVNVLLSAHDALRSMLSSATNKDSQEIRAHEDVMHALADAAAGDICAALPNVGAAVAAMSSGMDGPARNGLRVDLGTLDRLLTYTGELSIAFSRLQAAIDARRDVRDSFHEAGRLFGELREQATRLRLVPIGPMFRQQQRQVRDLATSHGKLARLVIEGEEIEVDAAVRDGLRDPVTHVIRNAIDHAIENPEVRRSLGKEPFGTITLRAMHTAGSVVVEVCDDGAGFHRGKLLARARAMGLASDEAALSDDELLRLVFVPGFSTADAVTELSGRGVGMDVVARNLAALKGSVSIRSDEGRGSVIALRVPLTLAIIDGFAVDAGGDTYVIPMDSVRECVSFGNGPEADRGGADTGVINLRGQPLPYVRLRSLLGFPGAVRGSESIVIVEHDGARAGVVVERLRGEMQAVVRPLGEGMQAADSVAAATFLGDGRIALILDVPATLRAASRGLPS